MKNKLIFEGLLFVVSCISLFSCNNAESSDITITYHLEDELNSTKVDTIKKGSKIIDLFKPSRVNGEYTFINWYKDKDSALSLNKENIFYDGSIVNSSIDIYAGWILTSETGDWINKVILDNDANEVNDVSNVSGLRSYLGNYYVTDCVPFFFSNNYTHYIDHNGSFYIYGENLDYSNILVYKDKLSKAGYKINEVSKNTLYSATNPNYEFNLEFGLDETKNDEFFVKVSYLDDEEYKNKDQLPLHIFASEGRYVSLSKIVNFDGVKEGTGKDIISARTYLTNNGLPASVIYYHPDLSKKVNDDDNSNGVNYLGEFLKNKLNLSTFNFSNSDGLGAMDSLATFRIQMQYISKGSYVQILIYSMLNSEIEYNYGSLDLSNSYFSGLLDNVPRLKNKIYDTIFYQVGYNMNSRNGIALNYFMINLSNDDLETYILELLDYGWKYRSISSNYAYLISENDSTFIYLTYYSKNTFLQTYPNYKNVNKGVVSLTVGLSQFAENFPKDDLNSFLKQNTRGEIPLIPEIKGGINYYFGKYKTQNSSTKKITITETTYQLQIEMSNDISKDYAKELTNNGWSITFNESNNVYVASSKDTRFKIQFTYSTNKTYGISYLVLVISYNSVHSNIKTYNEALQYVNYRFDEEVVLPNINGLQNETDFEVTEYYDGSNDRVLLHVIYHMSDGKTAMINASNAYANMLKAFENNDDWVVFDYNYDENGVITQTFYKNKSGLILYFLNNYAHNYIGIYRPRKI